MEKKIEVQLKKAISEGDKIRATILKTKPAAFRKSPLRAKLNQNFRLQRRLLGQLIRVEA